MGKSYKHGVKKCCYLTFVNMLAVVFLLLIIALLFGFEAYYKSFVVV